MLLSLLGPMFIALGSAGIISFILWLRSDPSSAGPFIGFGLLIPAVMVGIGILLTFPELTLALFG